MVSTIDYNLTDKIVIWVFSQVRGPNVLVHTIQNLLYLRTNSVLTLRVVSRIHRLDKSTMMKLIELVKIILVEIDIFKDIKVF